MIQVNNLSFSYTKQPFISDMSFSVSSGEIFGFLGPSRAGKSTLQKILIGLLTNYQGSAVVNGIECRRRTKHFYEKIGVDFEFSIMYEKLTAKENLNFFASLYEKKVRPIGELLETVGLEHDADKCVSDYSKGMKSRLNFIKALLHDPLFMRAIRLSFFQMLAYMRQDKMLFVACLIPIFARLLFRFAIPLLEDTLTNWFHISTILVPYYALIDIFFAMLSPVMFCFVSAMVSLEEADEKIAVYLFVTSLERNGYLIARLCIPSVAAFL